MLHISWDIIIGVALLGASNAELPICTYRGTWHGTKRRRNAPGLLELHGRGSAIMNRLTSVSQFGSSSAEDSLRIGVVDAKHSLFTLKI